MKQLSLLFVLPSAGGGGGSHSVVQECTGLTRLGARTAIATTAAHLSAFRNTYPELGAMNIGLFGVADDQSLADLAVSYDIAIATTFESVFILKAALDKMTAKKPKAAYYIQDYEPFFHAPGTAEWHRARESYSVLPEALLFAKTNWLCEVVYRNCGKRVEKVRPSIDHDTYFPGNVPRRENSVTISAMIRPKTPRRAPWRTLRVLDLLAASFPGRAVDLICFGSSREQMKEFGLRPASTVQVYGHLTRREVANVLRGSDLFLDLSDYQAFGRTGLEGMACGCVPVLPVFGGTDEYASNWQNAIVLDPRDDTLIVEQVSAFVDLADSAKSEMRLAAIRTASNYSIQRAAFSEFELFQKAVGSA